MRLWFPHILKQMGMIVEITYVFLFIYFWLLNGGRRASLFYTPQYQYLKAVSLIFYHHILNVIQHFNPEAALPIECPSVGVLLFFSF